MELELTRRGLRGVEWVIAEELGDGKGGLPHPDIGRIELFGSTTAADLTQQDSLQPSGELCVCRMESLVFGRMDVSSRLERHSGAAAGMFRAGRAFRVRMPQQDSHAEGGDGKRNKQRQWMNQSSCWFWFCRLLRPQPKGVSEARTKEDAGRGVVGEAFTAKIRTYGATTLQQPRTKPPPPLRK